MEHVTHLSEFFAFLRDPVQLALAQSGERRGIPRPGRKPRGASLGCLYEQLRIALIRRTAGLRSQAE
jgi:hypothetical protein